MFYNCTTNQIKKSYLPKVNENITFVIKYIKKYGACLRAELHPSISSHPCTHPRTYLNIIKLCTDYIRTCSKTWGPCNIYVVIST